MKQSPISIMMSLIDYTVFPDKNELEINLLNEDIAFNLYKISKEHDVAGIVANAVFSLKLLPKESEVYSKFQKQQMVDIYRYERMNHELHMLYDLFEKEQIKFIPLKGSVIRQYYPHPWLRTSCDIDFLIQENEVNKAVKAIEQAIGCSNIVRGTHDIGLFTKSGIHIELHFTLVEDGKLLNAKAVLNRVWEYAYLADGCKYRHLLKDEMFYFYHIAHMAIHFQGGGCGIRPFIDLQILDQIEHNENARQSLLAEGGLLVFSNQVNKLAQVWFANHMHDDETIRIEKYIVKSGIYGTSENYIAAQQVKQGNRFKFIVSRLWLPYDVLKHQYPSLKGKKLLLPFYEIRRWFKMLLGGRFKKSLSEIKTSGTISHEKSNEIRTLLIQLGLNE